MPLLESGVCIVSCPTLVKPHNGTFLLQFFFILIFLSQSIQRMEFYYLQFVAINLTMQINSSILVGPMIKKNNPITTRC